MKAHAIMLKPIPYGWAVTVTDGRELARFTGPGAKRRALLFINGGLRRSQQPGDAARYQIWSEVHQNKVRQRLDVF